MKKRIEFLDCLRGFTMILVVYQHLVLFCYGEERVFMSQFFVLFRMPLLFWLSGFLAHTVFTKEVFNKKIKNRFLGQLIPTIVIIAIYDFWFGDYFLSDYLTSPKGGYWFTFVLFMLFSIYAIIAYIMDMFSVNKNIKALVLSTLAIIGHIINTHYYDSPNLLLNLLSIKHILYYACFFVFGVISKMYYNLFEKIINNDWAITIIVLVFAILYNIPYNIPISLFGFLGIPLVYKIFSYYSALFNEKTKVGRSLSYIGKNTLQIYFLLNYINCGDIARYFNSTLPLIGVIFTFLLSIIVVMLCLFIQKLIMVSKPIYVAIFGPIKKIL